MFINDFVYTFYLVKDEPLPIWYPVCFKPDCITDLHDVFYNYMHDVITYVTNVENVLYNIDEITWVNMLKPYFNEDEIVVLKYILEMPNWNKW